MRTLCPGLRAQAGKEGKPVWRLLAEIQGKLTTRLSERCPDVGAWRTPSEKSPIGWMYRKGEGRDAYGLEANIMVGYQNSDSDTLGWRLMVTDRRVESEV